MGPTAATLGEHSALCTPEREHRRREPWPPAGASQGGRFVAEIGVGAASGLVVSLLLCNSSTCPGDGFVAFLENRARCHAFACAASSGTVCAGALGVAASCAAAASAGVTTHSPPALSMSVGHCGVPAQVASTQSANGSRMQTATETLRHTDVVA
jgi:hypothetical protein